jgi:hypothetical protein
MNVAMPDNEKPKRKAKPKRGLWRRILPHAVVIALTLLAALFTFIVIFPACGCSSSDRAVLAGSSPIILTDQTVISQVRQAETAFAQFNTAVAVTNQAVAIQIEQTNTAIMQATPSP